VAAPAGKRRLMALGLLFMLAGLICADVCFLLLLVGKTTWMPPLILQIVAALLVACAILLLRAGARIPATGAKQRQSDA
jgi:hypothetical protein